MNSQTFRLAAPNPRFLRNTRAQYSPLRRHSTTSAATLGLSRENGLDVSSAQQSQTGAADPSLRWWDPHLVDRLQPPLTRYHE